VEKLVLGEKLWEEKGKVTGMSVKSIGPEGMRIEESFVSEIKGLGRFPNCRNFGTFNNVMTIAGLSSGTGQGMCTAENGDNVAWKAYTIGKSDAAKSKGVLIIQFMAASSKLSWLNNLIVVYDIVMDMTTLEFTGTGYEWT
jgi:hypothetical protein